MSKIPFPRDPTCTLFKLPRAYGIETGHLSGLPLTICQPIPFKVVCKGRSIGRFDAAIRKSCILYFYNALRYIGIALYLNRRLPRRERIKKLYHRRGRPASYYQKMDYYINIPYTRCVVLSRCAAGAVNNGLRKDKNIR